VRDFTHLFDRGIFPNHAAFAVGESRGSRITLSGPTRNNGMAKSEPTAHIPSTRQSALIASFL